MSSPPEKHKHLMIDIETMGDAILTIGAVPFSIQRNTNRDYQMRKRDAV